MLRSSERSTKILQTIFFQLLALGIRRPEPTPHSSVLVVGYSQFDYPLRKIKSNDRS